MHAYIIKDLCIHFLGIHGEDTLTWAFRNFLTVRNKQPYLLAWIHSHVGGVPCNFSSVDLHTQHSYSKIHEGILGMVLEINNSSQLVSHDFFELSNGGKLFVEQCSRRPNCNSRSQHETCNNASFYQSATNKVIFCSEFSLTVQNFMPGNNFLEDLSESQNQSVSPGESLTEGRDASTQSSQNADTNISLGDILKEPETQKATRTRCKVCKKWMNNILTHLTMVTKCQKKYGEEYIEMKMQRGQDRKDYQKNYKKQNPEKMKQQNAQYWQKNVSDISKKRKFSYSQTAQQNTAIQRDCDTQDSVRKSQRILNAKNMTNVTQMEVDSSSSEENSNQSDIEISNVVDNQGDRNESNSTEEQLNISNDADNSELSGPSSDFHGFSTVDENSPSELQSELKKQKYDLSQFIVDTSDLVRCKICRKKMTRKEIHKHMEKASRCTKKHEERKKEKTSKVNGFEENQLSDSDMDINESENDNFEATRTDTSDGDADFENLDEMPRKKRKLNKQFKKLFLTNLL